MLFFSTCLGFLFTHVGYAEELYLLDIFFTNVLHKFELTKAFAYGFLLIVLWTKFRTRRKQESSVATAVHRSIRATGRREAHPALPRRVLMQEQVQK